MPWAGPPTGAKATLLPTDVAGVVTGVGNAEADSTGAAAGLGGAARDTTCAATAGWCTTTLAPGTRKEGPFGLAGKAGMLQLP